MESIDRIMDYTTKLKVNHPGEFLWLSQQKLDPKVWNDEVERAQFEDGVHAVGWGNWAPITKDFIPTKTRVQVKNYSHHLKSRRLLNNDAHSNDTMAPISKEDCPRQQ